VARQVADAFGDVLVEGDRIAKAAASGMRGGGEKAVVRGMPAIHIRVRDAAEDREIVSMFLELLQVRGEGVIASALFGKKLVRQQAEIVADREHPARLPARSGCGGILRDGGKGRVHGIQQWQ
jgi:hypothetical protein